MLFILSLKDEEKQYIYLEVSEGTLNSLGCCFSPLYMSLKPYTVQLKRAQIHQSFDLLVFLVVTPIKCSSPNELIKKIQRGEQGKWNDAACTAHVAGEDPARRPGWTQPRAPSLRGRCAWTLCLAEVNASEIYCSVASAHSGKSAGRQQMAL